MSNIKKVQEVQERDGVSLPLCIQGFHVEKSEKTYKKRDKRDFTVLKSLFFCMSKQNKNKKWTIFRIGITYQN